MQICCPHFHACSGCLLEKIDRPKSLEEAKQFFSTYGINQLQFHVGEPEAWRCRARLAVRGCSKNPCIGLFKEGTHQVVDIPFCKIHHPSINRAVEHVRSWIVAENIPLYCEKSGKGLLRYLQLTVARQTQQVQLVLVLNGSQASIDPTFLERLRASAPELWHSIWLNLNTRRDNLIFSEKWHLFCGEAWFDEKILGKTICYHPGSFMQANPVMFEKLLEKLAENFPKNGKLIEFYAGVGAIGLSLLQHCSRVACVEVVPVAKSCFEASLKFLGEEKKRLQFYCEDSLKCINLLQEPWDLVVVDPPRRGLEKKFIQALGNAKQLKKLAYISCGWESFKRDCILLSGTWRLSHAELFLFLPGSEHLEVLAIFERGS